MQFTRANKVAVIVVAGCVIQFMTPANAQSTDITGVSTSTSDRNDELVKNTEFEHQKLRDTYAGAGEAPNLRKDAWSWYWNEKAQVDIDREGKNGFFGNDGVSQFFKRLADNAVIPFWNAAMEYDFVRAGLLIVIAGALFAFGASAFMPKGERI